MGFHEIERLQHAGNWHDAGDLLAQAGRIADLVQQGAQAIILGCTEISLLVDQGHAAVPLFDTTGIIRKS